MRVQSQHFFRRFQGVLSTFLLTWVAVTHCDRSASAQTMDLELRSGVSWSVVVKKIDAGYVYFQRHDRNRIERIEVRQCEQRTIDAIVAQLIEASSEKVDAQQASLSMTVISRFPKQLDVQGLQSDNATTATGSISPNVLVRLNDILASKGRGGLYAADDQLHLWRRDQNPFAIVHAALWYGIEGDFDKSQTLYRQVSKKLEAAAELRPQDYKFLLATGQNNYAICELYRGRSDTAASYLVKSLQTAPTLAALNNARLLLESNRAKQRFVVDRLRTAMRNAADQLESKNPATDSLGAYLEASQQGRASQVFSWSARLHDKMQIIPAGFGEQSLVNRLAGKVAPGSVNDFKIHDDFLPLVTCTACSGSGLSDCSNRDCQGGQIVSSFSAAVNENAQGTIVADGLISRSRCEVCSGKGSIRCVRCQGDRVRLGG